MSIQTELTRITNAKAAIKTAVEGKGVTVPDGTLLDGMASLIGSIEAGGGATEPYVEETYDSSGDLTAAVLHGLPRIRPYMFYHCNALASITISDSITSIGENAFSTCALTSVTIPDSVTYIQTRAFYWCSALTSVTIGNSVTSIGEKAFYRCSVLTSVTFKSTAPLIQSDAFGSCSNLTTINVPWAEGTVANAPWGATNATINYNYTGA